MYGCVRTEQKSNKNIPVIKGKKRKSNTGNYDDGGDHELKFS
jgi:hypothetical protein